ncbi:MAG: carboxypeptidase M32 [Spirochaetota bacterium]
MNTGKDLASLKEKGAEIQLLAHTIAVLNWDQETNMPPKAIDERSEQISLVEGILHEKTTDPEIGELFEKLGVTDRQPGGMETLPEVDRAFLKRFYRNYRRKVKLPKRLVTELAGEVSKAQSIWATAKSKSDFSLFAPQLETVFKLVLEKAECIGYEEHPYDALLDEFEPFATTAKVADVFNRLKPSLTALVRKIHGKPQIDDSFLEKEYPVGKQEEFGTFILKEMGYDFKRGRLDVSAHPFTTTLGRDDVRLTTRYRSDYFKTGLFGIIHECGHGLYELGFSERIKGNLLADGASLGIHESQSRTWENIIGRSLPFWKRYYQDLKKMFPDNLGTVSLENFYKAINKVIPSFIRIEADEVTYNLHIILRFELETALVAGDISVKDLPEAWRSASRELFGITPDKDADGVLQDIHWSSGLLGYFPTYTLGNLYGAQFYSVLRKDIPGIDDEISTGRLRTVLNWLHENIHTHGSIYSADELCKRVSGLPLNPDYFLTYLDSKYSDIYEL